MANLTIRNLDNDVKRRLRVRAAEHHRSMEEEVRIILHDAVKGERTGPRDLAKFTRECFAPLGGVELELPPRGPIPPPRVFSKDGARNPRSSQCSRSNPPPALDRSPRPPPPASRCPSP